MKVAVASENPAKISAVRQAFGEVFDPMNLVIEDITVQIDVPEQPMSEAIIDGAAKRAQAALTGTDAELGVGIEAGLMQPPGSEKWLSVQICIIADRDGRQSVGMGPGYELPKPILDAVLAGESLRDAFERVLDVDDPHRNGAIYFLSKGLIDRTSLTRSAVRMALVHWMSDQAT